MHVIFFSTPSAFIATSSMSARFRVVTARAVVSKFKLTSFFSKSLLSNLMVQVFCSPSVQKLVITPSHSFSSGSSVGCCRATFMPTSESPTMPSSTVASAMVSPVAVWWPAASDVTIVVLPLLFRHAKPARSSGASLSSATVLGDRSEMHFFTWTLMLTVPNIVTIAWAVRVASRLLFAAARQSSA